MAERETGKAKPPLRFRVTVPPDHPAHALLARVPTAGRGQALLALLAAGAPAPARGGPTADGDPAPASAGGEALDRVAAALERIADALEAMAAGGARPVPAGPPDAGLGEAPSPDGLDALFGAFDDEGEGGGEP